MAGYLDRKNYRNREHVLCAYGERSTASNVCAFQRRRAISVAAQYRKRRRYSCAKTGAHSKQVNSRGLYYREEAEHRTRTAAGRQRVGGDGTKGGR